MVFEEFQECFGLAAPGAEVNIRDPSCSEKSGHTVVNARGVEVVQSQSTSVTTLSPGCHRFAALTLLDGPVKPEYSYL